MSILLPKWLTPRFASKYARRHEKRGHVLGESMRDGYSQADRYRAIAQRRDWNLKRGAKLRWRE